MTRKKIIRSLLRIALGVFVLINGLAIFHSYKFTHFAPPVTSKTRDPQQLNGWQKVSTLLFGVSNPRAVNKKMPSSEFETVILEGTPRIEGWYLPVPGAKGTIILFHGYGAQKSSLIDRANIFNQLGFNAFLIDFMGAGGSAGNQTTIGYREAEQVKASFDYLAARGEKNIYLFGTSMGAVAIMRAVSQLNVAPRGIMLECPFGTMYQTVEARFRAMRVPVFPLAGLLVFWGGAQNGFWAFGHNPTDYARDITCPALLMYGQRDQKVTQAETDAIFRNLNGPKALKLYPLAGHESYLRHHPDEWTQDITQFLKGE